MGACETVDDKQVATPHQPKQPQKSATPSYEGKPQQKFIAKPNEHESKPSQKIIERGIRQEIQQLQNNMYDDIVRKARSKQRRQNFIKNKQNQNKILLYGSQNNFQKVQLSQIKSTIKSLEGLPTQKCFIYQIRDLIVSKPQLCSILVKQFFYNLSNIYNQQYWTNQSRDLLIKLLINYIKFTVNQLSKNQKNQTSYTLNNFSQKIGKQLYKLINQTIMKNVWINQNIQYIKIFKAKKFSLQNHLQVIQFSTQIKNLCSNSTYAFVFLSSYFAKCCLLMEKRGISPNKINQALKQEVTKIKQIFSPKSKLQEQMKYLKRSFEETQLTRLPTKQFDYKIKTLTFKTNKKEQQLENLIIQMIQLAKKHSNTFTDLTSTCCLQNEGFGYKSNLKLKDKTQQMPFLRVKQKLLKDKINQYYKNKTYDCKTIQQLRKAQIEYLQTVLKQVYNKMDKVQFSVSDLLRGKCMFNKISHINLAAQKIIDIVNQRSKKGENIQIIQIDNRLSKITTDLVLKIRIQELVCQFQLALKFNQAQNQVHHKMYEVQRSKVFTPISMLFAWHATVTTDFFSSVDNMLSQNKKKDTAQLITKVNQFKKFIQYIKNPKQNTINQLFASKQDYQYIEKIKLQIDKIPSSSELSKKAFLRSGKCQKEIGRYKSAIQAFTEYQKNNKQDFQVYFELGESYKKLGKYKQAGDNYTNSFQLVKQTEDNQSKLKILIKMGQCMLILQSNDNQQLEEMLNFINQFAKENFGQMSQKTAETFENICNFQLQKGNQKKAQKNIQKAIQIFQKSNNKKNPNYIFALKKIGNINARNGKFAISLQNFNKALSLSQSIFGKQSLQTGQIIAQIGKVYQNMGKYKQSEQYYNKYMLISKNVMTKQSVNYANSLFFIISLYLDLQKYQEVQNLLGATQKIIRNKLGLSSLQYVKVCTNYGLYYLSINKNQQAKLAFQQSIQILQLRKQLNNQQYIMLMLNIAITYQNQQKNQQAMLKFSQIHQTLQKIQGQHIRQTVTIMNKMTEIFIYHLKQYQQAQQNLLPALNLYNVDLIEKDLQYYNVMKNLIVTYVFLHQFQNVKKYYDQCCQGYQITTSKESVQYAELNHKIGDAYVKIQKNGQAGKYYEEALKAYKKLQHPKQKQIQKILKNTQNAKK